MEISTELRWKLIPVVKSVPSVITIARLHRFSARKEPNAVEGEAGNGQIPTRDHPRHGARLEKSLAESVAGHRLRPIHREGQFRELAP